MFKERKTKLTLLSLLSGLVVVSTAFSGVIYAQQDDSNMTTFEEEALNGTEDNSTSTSDTSAYLSGVQVNSDNNTSAQNATSETQIADVQSLFSGLIVCDLGSQTLSNAGQTATASIDNSTTPIVSVKVMSRTEVAQVMQNETSTSSASETQTASSDCFRMGGSSTNTTTSSANNTPSANMTSSNATSSANATSSGNATSMTANNTTNTSSNATSMASTSSANSTSGSSNATSSGNTTTTAGNEQIAVIEGQDFAPGQVVLVFSDNAIVAVDDVDNGGKIEAAVPLDNVGDQFRFVETGSNRVGTFDFNGDTLVAAQGQGEIQAAGTNQDSVDIAKVLQSGNNAAQIEGQNSTSNSTSNSTK